MASLYQRGKVFWVSYRRDGQSFSRSLNTKDKTVAKYLKNKIENEISQGKSPLPPNNILIGKVFDEFIERCQVNTKARTVAYYKESLMPFINAVGRNTKIQNIKEKTIIDFLNSKNGISPGNTWHIIKTLKTFMNFAVSRGYVGISPVTVKKPKLPRRSPEAWTPEETKKILASISNPAIYDMIYVNLHVGLRPAELLRVRWEDIDWKNEVLTIPEAKDGEFRKIQLHPEVIRILYPKKQATGRIFPELTEKQMSNISSEIRKKSKVQRIKRFWYSIRHTFATEYYKQTKDLRELQEILGHSKISMTTVYVNPQTEHSRQQIRKLAYAL